MTTLAEKVAREFMARNIIAMDIVQDGQLIEDGLNALRAWKDQLVSHKDILDALRLAGKKRSINVASVPEPTPEPIFRGDDLVAVVAKVQGSGGNTYDTRLTFLPKRGHHCTCPDWTQRATVVGPCKHVLALGEAWRIKLIRALESIHKDTVLLLEVARDAVK